MNPASIESRRQLFIDVKDVFGTEAGQRVLAWWRAQSRQGHSVLIPGDSGSTHFYLGRQADVNAVVEILRADLDELLAGLAEQMDRNEQGQESADPMWARGPGPDDWLYSKERHHGEE